MHCDHSNANGLPGLPGGIGGGSVNLICICDMKNCAALPIMVPSFALIGVECKGNDHTSHHLTPTEAGFPGTMR